jgi:response regulator RpfG family c-di-GMP phosphodiesterase
MAEIDDVMSAVKELRNEVEKKSADQEKINKLQSALDASEKKNQELVKKQAELENAQREIAAKQEEIEKLAKASGDNSERIKELEKEIALHSAAPAGASDAWKNSEEHIAFLSLVANLKIPDNVTPFFNREALCIDEPLAISISFKMLFIRGKAKISSPEFRQYPLR